MPIYEYKCLDCGTITEVLIRSARDKGDLHCRSCQSKNIEKIFSPSSVVISGRPSPSGTTCCGQSERCDTPPCTDDTVCRRD